MDTKEIGAALALLKGKAIEQVPGAVEEILEEHPDWTTTVEDGAITKAKLTSTLKEEIETNTSDVSTLKNAIQSKAEVDGYYEQMAVGNAKQLLSTVGIEDQVPYTFRTAGGSADIGDRENDKIVGGTIAWNQIAKAINSTNWHAENHATATFANDEAVFTSDTAGYGIVWDTGVSIKPGHKYLFMLTAKAASSLVISLLVGGTGASKENVSVGTTYERIGKIIVTTQTAYGSYCYIYPFNSDGTNIQVSVKEVILFDLTQMFGSAIADYIYSLEQSHAGDGVAWFRKLFPKPYYAYNSGELLSVEGLQSHDMVGFNQWDEEWELGTINSNTGENIAYNGCIRAKNYIPVIPGASYYFKQNNNSDCAVFFYDIDKAFIGKSLSDVSFTTPNNCEFIRFKMGTNYGTTYKNDLCINLHWDGERDGEYEPHVKHSYPLDSDLVLRGIPKLDSNNKLYYDGDTYEPDGTVTRKYGIVDLGTLDWYVNDRELSIFRCHLPNMATVIEPPYENRMTGAVCSKYSNSSEYSISGAMDDKSWLRASNNIYIRDTAYTTAEAFKSAMSGVYLVYELATQTTDTADPFSDPQIVNDWGTEEYVTDSIVPVGHVTNYQPNLRAKLEMSPDSPEGDGDYIVRQSNGENTYVPLVIPAELPANPSTDGTYTLQVTVSNGTATLAWVSE